jgi:hypothetical protein
MTRLKRAGQAGALDVAASIAQFQEQIAALNDLMRQVAGNAAVAPGNILQADPLSAPFTLHVNPYTGNDRFVGGAYNTFEEGATDEEIIASKLKRIELQRLECGYTPQRPFRTINRAVIEAAIITSKNWYTYTDPRAHVDCVSIVLAPAVHTLYNDPGSANTNLASWGSQKNPTINELIAFNPTGIGGVLLPRGCSLCGSDLRKTTIRPNWVPATSDETSNYSNRRGMLKITGTGYFFGFTVMDKVGENRSHHLLDAFHFASKAELDAFYAKTFSAVGSGADLASALTVSRPTEYEIVGPIDPIQGPTEAWDTTASASPYIFNCSIRSDYGLGGAWIDGSKVGGLKSMVCANFTGVSLQKDMTCWQRYVNGNWTTTNYAQYIAANPDDIRMNPARMSRHISAINDAFIQEVSVFAIGQGIHHFTDRGGEVTVTNSNSSFGGCASLSKGYKGFAFPQDKNWTVSRIKVPLDIGQKSGNVRRIFLGAIDSINSSRIILTESLAPSSTTANVPELLAKDGYTLRANTFLWIENPLGDDWKATIPSGAWTEATTNRINIQNLDAAALALVDVLDENNEEVTKQAAVGRRVYLRRVVDTRSPSERQTSILLENTTSARVPERNFVFQTDPNNQFIVSALPTTGESVLVISNAGAGEIAGSGVNLTSEITIRRGSPSRIYTLNTFYRKGTVVRYSNKNYISGSDAIAVSSIPDPKIWNETFVHMETGYSPEDPVINEALNITIDLDVDSAPITTTCGINWSTDYTVRPEIRDQYRTSTDYLGVYAFLRALGFTDSASHNALIPKAESARLRDPNSAGDFPTPPSGGAATGRGYWGVEFRRPSVLRLYGHAWEWAGFLNYSKSIPAAQKTLGPQNKFSYYFTNQNGGRVVPQGSNEDGFNVTPRGLEDVETGATLTVENLVGGSIDQRQQTSFQSLEANNITVTGTLKLEGGATLLGFDTGITDAKTNASGLVKLARRDLLRAIPGSTNFKLADTDALINQTSDDGVVTIGALNYWRLSNNLVSGASGTVQVYVDPVNGNDLSLSALNLEPPSIASRATKTLRRAVDWANASYGSSVTVEYRIGPGVYVESGDIIFKTIARIRAWDFPARTFLNDERAGGTKPFMGQASDGKTWNQSLAYFVDPANHPVFLTRPLVTLGTVATGVFNGRLVNRPLRLVFEQSGTVNGVVWWGPIDTIVAPANLVPDSFFQQDIPPSTYRNPARSNRDEALNYMLRDILAVLDHDTNVGLRFVETRQCIEFRGFGFIRNVAFSAMGTPYEDTGNSQQYGLIFSAGFPIRAHGMWFIGNLKISNDLPNSPNFLSNSTYRLTGFARSIFTVDMQGESTSGSLVLNFDGFRQGLPADYNYTWNNLHLLNNDFRYTRNSGQSMQGQTVVVANTLDASGANWKTNGPGVEGLIGKVESAATTSGIHFHEAFLSLPSDVLKTQGWVGKFGNYARNWGAAGSLTTKSRGITSVVNGFKSAFLAGNSFLRLAATLANDINSFVPIPSNPGEVSDPVLYDALNVEVRGIRRGINVGVYYGVGAGGANVTVNPYPTEISKDIRL